MPNILDEYLIKLGAVVDQAGINRFQNVLRDATSLVSSQAISMGQSFLKTQTEIVSGFVAIGGAALGLADKVAMADQEYRLFALHMYMSKDAARGLKIAMDALGQPLENLTWDKELNERMSQLLRDQQAMAPGGDFDAQMRKIRDVRFEFTRMEVELEYLGMHVVQDFMQALGMGPDDLLKRLKDFNRWVITNMPEISRRLVTDFMPVWRDVKDVVKATGEALGNAATLFTNLVGLFSGDTAIEGTTTNLEKMLGAVHHVSSGFAEFALLIAHTESLLLHLVNAVTLLGSGEFKKAGAELQAGVDSISTKEGMELMGMAFGGAFGGPVGALMGGGAMHEFGGAMEHSAYHSMIDAAARAAGVDPDVAHALAMQESGERQLAPWAGHNAIGLMQLMPGTARGLNVDPYDPEQNARGGMTYFAHMLQKYRSVPAAVAGYHEGEGKMDAILAGKATLSREGAGEVAAVMRRLGQDVKGFTVGGITINITQPGASAEKIAASTVAAIKDYAAKSRQRDMSQNANYQWSYAENY